jgi:hypothetical protein
MSGSIAQLFRLRLKHLSNAGHETRRSRLLDSIGDGSFGAGIAPRAPEPCALPKLASAYL